MAKKRKATWNYHLQAQQVEGADILVVHDVSKEIAIMEAELLRVCKELVKLVKETKALQMYDLSGAESIIEKAENYGK